MHKNVIGFVTASIAIFYFASAAFAIEINVSDLNKLVLGLQEKYDPKPNTNTIIPGSLRVLLNKNDDVDFKKIKNSGHYIRNKIYYIKQNKGKVALPTINVFCILLTDSSMGENSYFCFSVWENKDDKLILDTLFDPIVTGYGNVEIADTLFYEPSTYFVLLTITGGDAGDVDESFKILAIDNNKKSKILFNEKSSYFEGAEIVKRLKILFLHGHAPNHEIMRIVTVNKSTESGLISAADTSFLFPDSLLKKSIRLNSF